MIVLDTHAWLWWCAAPAKLSARARDAIDRAARIGISAVSCLEVALLVARGRIALDRPLEVWVEQALAHDRVASLPVTARVAVRAGLLGGFPGDPADRILYATALDAGAMLVTKDRALRRLDPRRTVW